MRLGVIFFLLFAFYALKVAAFNAACLECFPSVEFLQKCDYSWEHHLRRMHFKKKPSHVLHTVTGGVTF